MRLIDAEKLEEILCSRCAQCSNDYGSIAGAVSGCLKLVQSQPTIVPPPNPPLTLDELREMDGEPVWISSKSINRYDVCCGCTMDYLVQFYKLAMPGWRYGETWLAYRRRPEEGTNATT